MEGNEWNNEELRKTFEEGREEVIDLHRKLFNLMVEFGLRASKTFQASKKKPLNPIQINGIVAKEIQAVMVTLSSARFVDLVARKAERDFYSGDSQPLSTI